MRLNKQIVMFLYFALFILMGNSFGQFVINSNQEDEQNYYQLKEANEAYWNSLNVAGGYTYQNGKKEKVPGWKQYKRWEWYWEQRINIKTGEFPKVTTTEEYEKYLRNNVSLKKQSTFNEDWVNLGTSSSPGGYEGIGRINCIAFHPTDENTFWVGSPSGGIWRTTDGGSSWVILNDNMPVLGVSDIVVTSDYSTSGTLYIATGDRDGGSMRSLGGGQAADNNSVGVYKSTDGGSSWFATALSFDKPSLKKIYRILMHPTNNNILIASTNSGIFKTIDGGSNWDIVSLNSGFIDMEFKPGDPTIIYASSTNYPHAYFLKSTDTGETWTLSTIRPNLTSRTEIAVTPNNPNIVYLLVTNANGGYYAVYKSTDSGVSFTVVDGYTTENMLGYYSDGSGETSGQGFYDLCIAASPTDADIVFIGGINTWKSTDGGVTWGINNMWVEDNDYNFSGAPVAHADKHVLSFQSGGVLFEGNDGGIYKTTNGGTSWTDLTNGMVISQLYRLGVSQTSQNKVITGLQDNGSKLFVGTWRDVFGGDGMECIIDHSNDNYMYVSYVEGEIQRTSDEFMSMNIVQISENIPGGQPEGFWVTPYIMHPNNSQTLYAGYDRVWKTTDRGNTWTSASQQLSATNKLRSLAIAPSNSNVLYTADPFVVWKTTDGGVSDWADLGDNLPYMASNSITFIAVNHQDANHVYITCGGYTENIKVFESTDGGSTWTNISNGLPNLPVMSIIHYKSVTDRTILFAGTDVGVYVKDGSNNWAPYNNNLPNVVVTELDIYYADSGPDILRAATYGRGLWETYINSPIPISLISFTAENNNLGVELNWITGTELNNFGFEIEAKSGESTTWQKIGFVQGNGNSTTIKEYSFLHTNIEAIKYSYRLKQIDNNGQFTYSNVVELDNLFPNQHKLMQNYPNPFNPTTTIKFNLSNKEFVSLKIFDILGNEVTTLINNELNAGYYESKWDASNLSSGVYFYRISAGSFVETRKMNLIK